MCDGTPHSLSPDVAHLVAVEQDDQEFLNYITAVRDQMPKGDFDVVTDRLEPGIRQGLEGILVLPDGKTLYARENQIVEFLGRRFTTIENSYGHPIWREDTGHASAYAEDAPGNTVVPAEPPPMQDVRENPTAHTRLPVDSMARKNVPMATGVLDYFPDALADVAMLSKIGNDKHNPGEPLHWAREKSTDHADCIIRHMTERGTIDTDGRLHATKVAWRALAQLQVLIEELRAAGVDY